jgi:hypothetical protein
MPKFGELIMNNHIYLALAVSLSIIGCHKSSNSEVMELKLKIAQLEASNAELKLELNNIQNVTAALHLAAGSGYYAKMSCIAELRMISSAKEMWGMANDKHAGDVVVESEVDTFRKKPMPCPGGGEYTYNVIGITPRCSLHGSVD